MSQVRDSAFMPSSRSSSVGADSFHHDTTPETKGTIFSPDDKSVNATTKVLSTLYFSGPANPIIRYPGQTADAFASSLTTAERDPFVSAATINKSEQKLSPTASAFRPPSGPVVAHGSLDAVHGPNTGLGANRQSFSGPVQTAPPFSTDLGLSRCLVVYSTSHPAMMNQLEEYIMKLDQLGTRFQSKRNAVAFDGKIYFHTSNIRDAIHIHDNIQLASPDWHAEYVPVADYIKVRGPAAATEPISDGKVQIIATRQDAETGCVHVESVVRTFLETQGDVFALQRQAEVAEFSFRAVVEFSDAELAISVVHRFNQTSIGGCHLVLSLCQTEEMPGPLRAIQTHTHPFNEMPRPVNNMANLLQDLNSMENLQNHNSLMVPGRLNPSPIGFQSPATFQAPQPLSLHPAVSQNFPPAGPNRFVADRTPTRSHSLVNMPPMSPMAGRLPMMGPMYHTTPPATPMAMGPRGMQPYGRRQFSGRAMRSPYHNHNSHHNHVDINRIRDGVDVRTTIMLRNIPNKVNQQMLKNIIDESSWGKYDFMYLRIDFQNDCNVGYAFINFVDPLDIIDFVNARGNKRWNCFKSDKVAEISYATIQGKDCLVQKFRNSSVMLEAPHCRPKLYYTTNGPHPELAGEEEPFPGPDNQSKMKRSVENAEHVGLFTPSSGQHFREEQRRRRSQFDRGTRLAALEEYESQLQQQQRGHFLMP